jgi:aminomuconate-semialdehyde/2-hydroxymuconate-6-semialdehyde dehydrogenase
LRPGLPGTERIYVERPIFDVFLARLKTAAEALRPGDPFEKTTSFGPLISQEHRTKVLAYYERAKEEGAQVVAGGGVPDLALPFGQGSWVQPTIWTGLADDSAAVREEIFGPCCHVRPFDTEDEAVALVNDSPMASRPLSGPRTSPAHIVLRRRLRSASPG